MRQKRLEKDRMKGVCNLIPKNSRAKVFRANKELYDSKCTAGSMERENRFQYAK